MSAATDDRADMPPAPRAAITATTLALLAGLAAILLAWGFQIIGGYVPCKLCYQERIPYYLGLPLLAAALALAGRGGRRSASSPVSADWCLRRALPSALSRRRRVGLLGRTGRLRRRRGPDA
ncbi:Disulfide bond formation protein DsbB [Methylobrevis pamukkalensis]|uniref:Disulfide bond formation protein DsbB n=1 Tax=Methylobrevis pamukkalensis TaxID=1439726 RepID=A0A1E3H9A8_9HYPH|nr:Disulfide bond formation protein DsbB [Methylobrevis pamukkalensis]